MKNRRIRIVLAALLVVVLATAPVLAVNVDILDYNVAGLPSIINGGESKNIRQNQVQIGKQINKSGCEIIAVQEDFNHHKYLAAQLNKYPFRTPHSGGVPGGDGLNIYSKYPVFNAQRTAWDMTYGIIKDGADELTPKGILYSIIYVGDGIFVDFYDIHADAFEDAGSVAARNDNFRQLAQMIECKNTGRPVIITGDFNTSAHRDDGAEFRRIMIEEAGFSDAWTVLKNGGDYLDYSTQSGESAGNWDSIEKFLYRSSAGVTVEPLGFEYRDYKNCKGVSVSDHCAAWARFSMNKTADFKSNKQLLHIALPNPALVTKTKIRTIIKDLGKILANKDQLIDLLKDL